MKTEARQETITDLLRQIEPLVEWLERGGLFYECREWGVYIHPNYPIPKAQQAQLLGAICADCDAKGWYLYRDWGHVGIRDGDTGTPICSAVEHEFDNTAYTALLAYRDALGAIQGDES